MIDLVLRGDTVITPHGVGAYDIHVANGKIASVTVRGDLPLPDGARLIDATGKIVMPGGHRSPCALRLANTGAGRPTWAYRSARNR